MLRWCIKVRENLQANIHDDRGKYTYYGVSANVRDYDSLLIYTIAHMILTHCTIEYLQHKDKKIKLSKILEKK